MFVDDTATKYEWLSALKSTHEALIEFVDRLPDESLCYSKAGKWNAGQQLQHVYLCLQVISQALASKKYIQDTFGRIDRPALNYEEVIARYKAGLAAGGRAPERFIPGPFEPEQKAQIIASLRQVLDTIKTQLESYSEKDCETLVLPHPFVGKLSIKELFFLMTEHASLHQRSIAEALKTTNN
jgi:hypothetical protein